MIRKRKKILLLAAMILGGSLLSVAQRAERLSLNEAINKAMQNNITILNSKLDVKSTNTGSGKLRPQDCLTWMSSRLTSICS